jgi:hypothetical protein
MRVEEGAVPLSEWSRWVAELLTDNGFPDPVLEHRIEQGGCLVAQVDLAYPYLRVAIELDSVSFRIRRHRITPDAVRRNDIGNAGWHLQTVTWEPYAARTATLLQQLGDACELRRQISRVA